MKITITLEHWNKAKNADAAHYGFGRNKYCPIAQCFVELGHPDVEVNVARNNDSLWEYIVEYGEERGKVTGCGSIVARTFDREELLPADLLPCTFELEDAG